MLAAVASACEEPSAPCRNYGKVEVSDLGDSYGFCSAAMVRLPGNVWLLSVGTLLTHAVRSRRMLVGSAASARTLNPRL